MKYFSIKELCRSATANELGIDNTPTDRAVENMTRLIKVVLDPLREAYGQPITVNSGYRSPALNKAVGGVKSSQHLTGEAADITVGSKEGNKWLFEYIKNNLPYDQLIDEYDYSWVHVSLDADMCNRGEIIHTR
ncbi:MAG: peptidase M15 [Bacteroidaceae bacterium]|nr:peptidase M15 [Bacteroidaceae bacterium]